MTTSGPLSLALAGALAVLAACASAAGPAPATAASCASAAPWDDAGLAAAFDSLHALRVRGRSADSLVLMPYDSPPRLDNRSEVARLLREKYPPTLSKAGVGGTAEMAALIDASGTVHNVRLVRGSTYPELDQATHAVATAMRVRPARKRGCAVPYFMSLPITWTVERV